MLDLTGSPACRASCPPGSFTDTTTSPRQCGASCPLGLLIDKTTSPSSCVPVCSAAQFTDITTAPRSCVGVCLPGTYRHGQECTDQCVGGLLVDLTLTPSQCVTSCSSPAYHDATPTPQQCVSACPGATVVDTTADPQQCLASCPPSLYKDITRTPAACVATCSSALITVPELRQCVLTCPLSLPLYSRRTSRCVSTCASEEYAANGECSSCEQLACGLLTTFRIRNVTEQASFITLVVSFNSSSADESVIQAMRAVSVEIETNSTRRLVTINNSVQSSRVTDGMMAVTIKTGIPLTSMARLGIIVEVGGGNYSTQFLSMGTAHVNYYDNIRISSMVVGAGLLLAYVPLKAIGLRYNYLVVWQIALFYLYLSSQPATSFFNFLAGLSVTDFLFFNPFAYALPASFMEMSADRINSFGMNNTFFVSAGGCLFFGLLLESVLLALYLLSEKHRAGIQRLSVQVLQMVLTPALYFSLVELHFASSLGGAVFVFSMLVAVLVLLGQLALILWPAAVIARRLWQDRREAELAKVGASPEEDEDEDRADLRKSVLEALGGSDVSVKVAPAPEDNELGF